MLVHVVCRHLAPTLVLVHDEMVRARLLLPGLARAAAVALVAWLLSLVVPLLGAPVLAILVGLAPPARPRPPRAPPRRAPPAARPPPRAPPRPRGGRPRARPRGPLARRPPPPGGRRPGGARRGRAARPGGPAGGPGGWGAAPP